MRVIGFGAHPDDVEIFFFGTLAASRAMGHDIGWVVASDGAKGGRGTPAELRRKRRSEAENAGRLLDVAPVFLDRADGELETDSELVQLVGRCIVELEPSLVITHAANDYHADHRALSRAVKAAAGYQVPVLYCDTLLGVAFEPTVYVDISAHMQPKREAIRVHESQDADRFVEACETWNRFRSMQCGAHAGFAEAFRFEPAFPHADIRHLLPPPPAADSLR